jgi:predicted lipoprotein with Yx(FWY)xxD motif
VSAQPRRLVVAQLAHAHRLRAAANPGIHLVVRPSRDDRRMKPCVLLITGVLALAGCGDDEGSVSGQASTGTAESVPERAATTADGAGAAAPQRRAAAARGTTITLRRSRFGPMLFNARRQAIYIFQDDRRNRTVCYGECAEAWPPVYTTGRPRAASGVRASLLGTITRRDGRRQVTYAGKPLYYYAHEGPGEVRCHNVNLNGGLWWVVGPDGKRRP